MATKYGEVKIQTPNGVQSLPVYNAGSSGGSVYEMLKVETPSGIGYIPLTDPSDAAYPYLKVQTQNHGILAVHDAESVVISEGLVSRYLFEGNVNDSTGSYDGNNNGVSFVSSSQEGSQSANFDGSDTVENCTPTSAFSGGEMTMCFWMYPHDTSNRNGVINGNTGDSGDDRWDVEIQSGQIRHDNHGSSSDNNDLFSVSTDTWIHIAIVWDANNGSLEAYKNGSLSSDISTATYPIDGNDDITLGIYKDNTSRQYDGYLDDLRFYDRLLSESEIDVIASGSG